MKLKNINYKRMDDLITYIAEENKVKKAKVYFDFFLNAATRGIGYVDYLKGNYINLSNEEKKNYLTKRNYVRLVKYLNKRGYQMIFHDKIVFNRIFKDYIGRDFIDIREVGYKGFKKFVTGKENVFAKKHNSFGGDGVTKVNIAGEDLKVLFNQLYNNKQYLIEDTLIQNEYLDWINPKAVNNVRLVTLLKDGEVYVVFKTLRINAGSEEVISCHDIYMTLDDEGNVLGNVVDDECNIYKKHPVTGFKFKGAKIPHMDKALELVKSAAKLVPEMRWIGWDVAITEDGAAIIEGNNYPSFGLHQFYLLNDGEEIGKYKKIKEILKDEI
jgi:hypothetical protein